MKGVVAYYDKNDIPGKNTFTPKEMFFPAEEELFCDGTVKYYSQPVGVIVATSQELADKACELVEVTYDHSTDKPLLTVREILSAGAKDRIVAEQEIKPTSKGIYFVVYLKQFKTFVLGNDVKHIIKGSFDIGSQYHFHMETQCCLAVPTEDGFDMYPATQWLDVVQNAASAVLNIPAHK